MEQERGITITSTAITTLWQGMAFVNKMDRVGVDFLRVQKQINEHPKDNAVPIQIPIDAENNLQDVIDLVKMKAIIWDEASQGVKFEYQPIPAELEETAREWHDKMPPKPMNSCRKNT